MRDAQVSPKALRWNPLRIGILALRMGQRHVIHFHPTYANMLWSWHGSRSLSHLISTQDCLYRRVQISL